MENLKRKIVISKFEYIKYYKWLLNRLNFLQYNGTRFSETRVDYNMLKNKLEFENDTKDLYFGEFETEYEDKPITIINLDNAIIMLYVLDNIEKFNNQKQLTDTTFELPVYDERPVYSTNKNKK